MQFIFYFLFFLNTHTCFFIFGAYSLRSNSPLQLCFLFVSQILCRSRILLTFLRIFSSVLAFLEEIFRGTARSPFFDFRFVCKSRNFCISGTMGKDDIAWSRARKFNFVKETDEESFSQKIVKESEDFYLLAMYSRFSLRLCTGSLDLETYRQYRGKEVFAMEKMVQAFDILRKKADEDDIEVLSLLVKQIGGEADYRMLTEVTAEDVNDGDLQEVVEIYADELLMQAHSFEIEELENRTIAYTVAATAAWLRLYSTMGQQFKNLIKSDNRFRNWFKFYGSYEVMVLVEKIELLLDKSCVNLSEAQLQIVENCYRISLSDVVDLFSHESVTSAVPIIALPPEKTEVFVFVQIASVISFHQKATPSYDTGVLVDVEQDYQRILEAVTPVVPVFFDHTKVEDVFERLSLLRDDLYRKVEESGKLVGLDLEHMQKSSLQSVSANSDFISLINKMHRKKDVLDGFLHLYSLDYSSAFIHNLFRTEMNKNMLHCSANRLVYDGEGISTGRVYRFLRYPGHLAILPVGVKRFNICVGSTVDDLLCLLKASVGIVVEPAGSLVKLGTCFGVQFLPLLDLLLHHQCNQDAERTVVWQNYGILYVAKDWGDVSAFIRSLHDIR